MRPRKVRCRSNFLPCDDAVAVEIGIQEQRHKGHPLPRYVWLPAAVAISGRDKRTIAIGIEPQKHVRYFVEKARQPRARCQFGRIRALKSTSDEIGCAAAPWGNANATTNNSTGRQGSRIVGNSIGVGCHAQSTRPLIKSLRELGTLVHG